MTMVTNQKGTLCLNISPSYIPEQQMASVGWLQIHIARAKVTANYFVTSKGLNFRFKFPSLRGNSLLIKPIW